MPRLLVALVLVTSTLGLGATVTYYEEALPTTMNPLFARSMTDYRTHELVFDRLFYRSTLDNEITSRLVATSEVIAGTNDLKVVLKDGIKWHDGRKFEPADVCFTIAALLDPNTPSPFAKAFRDAMNGCDVDKAVPNTLVIHMRRFYHEPREHLGFPVLPEHSFSGTAIQPDADFSLHPVGTGPMTGSKGRRDVKFEKFANLHHTAKIDVLSMSESGDPFVAVRTLLNSGVSGVISVAPQHRPDIMAAEDVSLRNYDLRSWWFVAINPNKEPFSKKGVRQALNLTLDRAELRQVTVGYDPEDADPPCEFVSGPFVQSSPYYNRQIKVQETADHAKATDLLNAAGLVLVAGHWTYQGQSLNLRIGMNAKLDSEAKDLLNQLGNQMQAGGFDRTVYKVTEDDWARKAIQGQLGSQYDMLIGKWSFGIVEDVNPLFQTRGGEKGAYNIFNYSNPDVDSMLKRFDTAKTDTEARDAYHELHAYLADDLPYLFLWKLDTKSAWRNEIRNNIIAPYFYFTDFDGWTFSAPAAPAGG